MWAGGMGDQALMNLSADTYESGLNPQMPNTTGIVSLAFPVPDLDQDNATDLLVLNITSDLATDTTTSKISAVSGRDGSTLWEKDYPDSLAYALPAGDLNGDGRTDVMVDEVLAGTKLIPYSSVSALDGGNGTTIWSMPQILSVTLAYPIKDTTGENASEFLVHVFGIDSLNNTVATKITLINGTNGTEITARIFPGAVAIEYPAGNFTGDHLQDSISAVYELDESGQNITTAIEAVDGKSRSTLWNRTFSGFALAVPTPDLTGDGKDEVIVYLMSSANNTTSNEIAVIQGADGLPLWQKSFGSSLAYAVAGPDLTGDGKSDLIVYKLGESEDSAVEALKGDDGKLLWSKTGMMIILQ
jgi:hypothetical protein